MRFSDALLDDIRNRLPITQVVGEHVIWDKRKSNPGRGDMWANCPFHGEKTPSFHADDQRGRYHCFSCGASGDHFRFLTEKTGMSFPEAVELLANRAGVSLPKRDPREEKQAAQRRSLYDVMEVATQYFEAALSHNIGARARGYLSERGVSAKMQSQFRLGFSPDSRNGLKEHLAANGVSLDEMKATGLVVHGQDIAVPYDRFRNRLMFPIMDFRGRVIAFGGRALSADVPAKYLNSPETELFHKRMTLYNGKEARQASHDGKALIVVEGYLDVIAAVSAGFTGAVAPLGTALTEDHVTLLWRMSDTPVLCFDGDSAGQKAAERAADFILPMLQPGQTVKIAMLPDGLDPDDIIKARGRDAFGQLIEGAQPLSEFVWSMETRGVVPETPEARAALEARLRARAQAIGDQSVKRHYGQAFDEKLQAFFGGRRGDFRQGRQQGGNFGAGRGQFAGGRGGRTPRLMVSDSLKNSRLLKSGSGPEVTTREAAILMSLINHPALIEPRLDRLAMIDFDSPDARRLMSSLVDIVTIDPETNSKVMVEKLTLLGFGALIDRMQQVLLRQGIWQSGAEIAEIDAETGLKHALALHYKSVQLNKELKAAEMALGDDLSEENLERLRDIQNQITSVDGTEALIEGFGSLSGRGTRGF